MSVEWTLLALRLLAVAVLYAFLTAAILVIWRELHPTPSARPAQPEQPAAIPEREQTARLRVSSGGEIAAIDGVSPGVGVLFALTSPVTVGRAPDNGIVLLDECVSQHHARFERHDGEWWVCDLGSRNGTSLNGIPISRPAPVADGDVITFGKLTLTFEANENTADQEQVHTFRE